MSCVLPVCHSSFSLLYGTESPEELVKLAGNLGYTALALADRNSLYGAYDFCQAAGEKGIKPIIGARLDTTLGNLTLLCRNYEGYKNLSRLITYFHLHQKPDPEKLREYRENLICLTGLSPHLIPLREIFGDSLFINPQGNEISQAFRLRKELPGRIAACPEISFGSSERFQVHRLLRAIEGGYLLDNLPPGQHAGGEAFLQTREDYTHLYGADPKVYMATAEILERVDFKFPERNNILPRLDLPGEHFDMLKNKCLDGLRSRREKLAGPYLARLDYELTVIQKTGFVDYFLVVSEIIEYCRADGIAAVGRGSAAGSLVSYCLGITEVDPLKEGLYFERFLNEARRDCPDIDLDIDWRRRDDVLEHVYKLYGDAHVAMIATYVRFQPRLAVRETAKVMGLPPEEITRFVRHLPHQGMNGAIAGDPVNNYIKNNPDWQRFAPVLKASRQLAGLPRHLGIHSGGIVITPAPLTDYIPLQRAAKGIVVTQCDMYQAEKIGLVKIDILGQRGLAVLADCRRAVAETEGRAFQIPEYDEATYRTLRSGKTIGVVHIESPGLRALLRDLKPRELNDITLALALIRPGASESGMKKVFLDRFRGKEATVYPHRNLEEILRETQGVFIYQEQVILAAQKIAGFNMAASDQLRRAITKKRKETDVAELGRRFQDGAAEKGVTPTVAENIFRQLRQFAAFGFCKAHAATYGFLAYQAAYYKTHYPGIFMAAVLRNGGGYYPSAVYVAETRRLGIKIRPPDLNLAEDHDCLKQGEIFLGLERVRDLTAEVRERIKKGRPFSGFEDFLGRVDIGIKEMENLIRVGFFDDFEKARESLFWKYRIYGRTRKTGGLFGARLPLPRMKTLPRLESFSRYDIYRAEADILELAASFHPLTLFPGYRDFNLEEICKSNGSHSVEISGWRADIKRIKTRQGQYMVFMTMDSLDDTFEVILFPDIYRRFGDIIRKYRYLTVRARLNREEALPALMAEEIFPAPTGLPERSHL